MQGIRSVIHHLATIATVVPNRIKEQLHVYAKKAGFLADKGPAFLNLGKIQPYITWKRIHYFFGDLLT
ncbi:hypothetical protein QD47_01285 [Paenibacillus terrae]|uniref:Uncharacterized protein n=1 Tax=Paenibacillus terrae TaxID=159743 RepID=A0A0D7X826_9BACL|nr:hypothetical protein QD47_01285 [Paenibacillus terrae]